MSAIGRQYAANDQMGIILPWDNDFAEMYARFESHRSHQQEGKE